MPHSVARHRALSASVLTALLLPLLAGALVALASPAHAAAYRYWGYFQQSAGSWAFAQVGPAQSRPADGSVEGWRFAVADETSTRFPRALPSFDEVCSAVPAEAGRKRVAVVLDFGRPADAPDGSTPPKPTARCAVVDTAASGAAVLAAVATVRAEKSLTCAVDGFPATGCGDPVASVSAEAAAPDDTVTIAPAAAPVSTETPTPDTGLDPGPLAGIVAALLLVAVLGVLAVRRSRRAGD